MTTYYILGNLYGLEKFWAFLKYYKGKIKFEVNPDLKKELDKFKEIDDFRIQVTVTYLPISHCY